MVMILAIYLIKRTIVILICFKRPENFLMNAEVIFHFHLEVIYNYLKKKGQNDSLKNIEKKVLKRIDKYLKNFKNDLDKLQKCQLNIIYG